MSGGLDAELRRLERAALLAPEDAEAVARFVAAHLRAGGRDPRRDPRKGDMVASKGYLFGSIRVYRPRAWAVIAPERGVLAPGRLRFVTRERVLGAGQVYRRVNEATSVTLPSWRRWAAGGTVLAIGPTLPALDAVGLMLALRETLTVAVRAVGARLAREVAHFATTYQHFACWAPNRRPGPEECALREAACAAAVALGAGVVHLRVDALLREIAVDEADSLVGPRTPDAPHFGRLHAAIASAAIAVREKPPT